MPDLIERRNAERWGYPAAFAIIAAAVILRFYKLAIDPPLFFTGSGQDLLTDPYNVTHFARNKALFGNWDIFDYPRWIAFKYSLSSLSSYLFFIIGGVSRVTANLSAVFLNLGGIVLFLLGLKRSSRTVIIISALLLLTNMTLLVYGRYPFLENGLIFLCGLLFFLFMRYYPRNWVLFLSGALISLCALMGKMFGLVMIIPLAFSIWNDNRELFWGRLWRIMLSFAISFPFLMLLLYGGNIHTFYNYVAEQTLGMYGTPIVLSSPTGLFEQMVTFGGDSRLFYFTPFLLLLLFIAIALLILRPDGSWKTLRENRALMFNIGWLAGGYLLLMLFNYRPMRYQLFLLLPVSGVVASLISYPFNGKAGTKFRPLRFIFLFLLCWHLCTQLAMISMITRDISKPTIAVIWYYLIPGLILSGIIFIFRNQFIKIIGRRHIIYSVLVGLCVISQSYWIYTWFRGATYNLQQAGQGLDEIVSERAVIIGPYSQALTIDNRLKSFIYMFGLARKESDLFQRFPFTHLATDMTNWNRAVKDYPVLRDAPQVARYWIRDVQINIVKVDELTGADRAIPYRPTEYEIASVFYSSNKLDSAGYYAERFGRIYPRSKSGYELMAGIAFRANNFDRGFAILDDLVKLYPFDASLYFDKAVYHYKIYCLTQKNEMLDQATYLFERATALNPYLDKDVTLAKKQIDDAFRK
jgi:tetratricopeptide (TPR) repeat protein/4-amino-4-deoxy-L-arabinose transferase-like glycosyltransferase